MVLPLDVPTRICDLWTFNLLDRLGNRLEARISLFGMWWSLYRYASFSRSSYGPAFSNLVGSLSWRYCADDLVRGHGGGQTLTETQACLAVIGISLGCYYFARQLAISPEQTREYFEQIEAARIEDSRID